MRFIENIFSTVRRMCPLNSGSFDGSYQPFGWPSSVQTVETLTMSGTDPIPVVGRLKEKTWCTLWLPVSKIPLVLLREKTLGRSNL